MNAKATNQVKDDELLISNLFDQLDIDESELDMALEPTAESAAVQDEKLIDEELHDVELLDDLNNTELETLINDEELDLSLEAEEVENSVVSDKKVTEPEKLKTENVTAKQVPKSTQQRVTHYNSKKSEVLLDRLGGSADMILLEASDIDLPNDKLKEKQENLLLILNNQPTVIGTRGNVETVQKKVAEKVIILFTYFKNGGNLNKVMRIAFETIITDGYITTGKGGNLYNNLLNAHYSEGTARAQAGQMLQMFPLLKIATKEGNKLIPNEQSLILAKMKADLFPKEQ
ncbi:hypothetical protein OKC46_01035 [Acinetobacter baumannii]|uniref:hypothetical protein n=1 Tax=Acinetobacter baumannii TaxID=470 RepID=UPI00237F4AA7|nr:hypothetical protein [Acinetobacter baumannii]MDE3318576.1 hypothetical protein [Acinetobacter baumannii]MDX2336873.1 hypothetical protein [Acinetobacter baumannii]